MDFDDPCGRSDDDERQFSDVIGEAVNQYLGEIPSTEIIGVLSKYGLADWLSESFTLKFLDLRKRSTAFRSGTGSIAAISMP